MQNSKYEAWNYETTSSKIDSAHLLQIVKGFSFLLIFTLWLDIKKVISLVLCALGQAIFLTWLYCLENAGERLRSQTSILWFRG